MIAAGCFRGGSRPRPADPREDFTGYRLIFGLYPVESRTVEFMGYRWGCLTRVSVERGANDSRNLVTDVNLLVLVRHDESADRGVSRGNTYGILG